MSRIKANRLFSFLALFSIVFNNILTPLSVYAEDVQENPQQQESVVSEPTPTTEETQPDVEITPTETIIPTPTIEETITPTPEITTEASQETNEGAQSQAPPTTDTPTPTPSVEISAPQGDEKLQVNIVEDVQAVSIDYMDIQYNPDGTASIKTDKLDYAPTDVVVITGTGFEANIEYEIKITGSYNFESFGRAMSNDAGNILYSIQLDGTPRPNYRAEVLRNGMLYASVDFTDSESSTAGIPFSDSFGSSNQNNVTNWYDSDGNSSNARIEGSSISRPGSPTTGHLRISNNSWVCRTINTSGFSSIQLKYYWRGDRDAGASDNGYSEYKIGGNCSDNSGWEEIRKDDLDSNTNGWSNQQTFSFPSSVNNQIIHIRFRGASDDSNEEYRVDDVSVTGVAATSIQVTSVNGNQPPFDFSCQTNPLSNPVSLTGNGTGTTPPGQIQQYHVLIDWGDGTVDTNLGTFTPNSGQGNFTYTFSGGPHSYTVAGDYVITVKLYHSQAPGQDNQIDATTTLSMCIPPTKGSITITKDSKPNDTQNFLFTVRDSQGNIVGNAELDDWSGSASMPDNKSFTLNAGTYYITETAKDGSSEWKMTDVICRDDAGSLVQSGISPDGKVNVDVFSGQNTNCTFVNTKYGGVYGEKFNDKNGNNIDDSGEEDLRGWRIYVDLDEDGKYDSGEPTDVTDSGGDYSIGGLLPGEYSICEVQQDGWYSSLPNNALCQKTTIHSDGGDWDPVNFGNHGIVTIKAYKIVCPMEASLPNWGYGPYGSIDGGTADWFLSHHTGCYYQDNWEFQWGYGGRGGVSSVPGDHVGYAPKTGDDYDEWKNFNTATDNHHGSQYSAKAFINDLKGASSIWVREVLPSDEWLPFSDDTSWPRDNDVSAEMYCSGDILNYDNYDEIDNPLYGQSYYCIAFNTLNKGKITGVKWEDIDGDMHYERGENTIAGWNITATDSQGHSYSASTNASGEYTFDNLMPGEYVVCEENQRGYIQTFPSGQSCHTVTVIGGRTESGNNFGNMPVNLDLEIEKTNVLNSSNATVDYTIKVTNTGNMNYNSYEIHDALPGGFNYLAGSSYLNDNPIDDPVFNSGEAMWEIEEGLTIGETAILTYRASIDSSLPAGFYTNFAYAVGVFNYPWDNPEPSVFERAMVIDDSDDYTHEEPIIIRVSDTATTEIVDSQVELLSSVSYGGKLTGQVLGASTDVLPATGSETWVIMLATAFVIIGFVTKGAAIMIERKRKNE